ncbi:MAG: hypothetical protein ACYCTH_10675, partial [Cellulomonas sp.]
MSQPTRRVRDITYEQVVEKYDEVAAGTSLGLDFYATELRRRDQATANAASDRLARTSLRLSYATLLLSVVAVVIALLHYYGAAAQVAIG